MKTIVEEIAEMQTKWKRYNARLHEGDGEGSLAGASYLIAISAVSDIARLIAIIEGTA